MVRRDKTMKIEPSIQLAVSSKCLKRMTQSGRSTDRRTLEKNSPELEPHREKSIVDNMRMAIWPSPTV